MENKSNGVHTGMTEALRPEEGASQPPDQELATAVLVPSDSLTHV